MRTTVRVIQGRLTESETHRTSAIEAAYQHFRLDKQGSLVSPKTLRHYEWTIRPFLFRSPKMAPPWCSRTRADLANVEWAETISAS